MGLDNCASRTEHRVELSAEDRAAFEAADIHLVQGLFSMEGGSFRGKLYATLILDVTGHSLYRPWTPPEVVHEMAAALQACDPAALLESYHQTYAQLDLEYHGSLQQLSCELCELRKFFQVCSQRGLGLLADV
jgi:hypothetical protein